MSITEMVEEVEVSAEVIPGSAGDPIAEDVVEVEANVVTVHVGEDDYEDDDEGDDDDEEPFGDGGDGGDEGEAIGEESVTPAMRMALGHLFAVQDRLDKAISEHAEVAEDAKTAKKRVESLQEDLRTATKALRSCRDDQEPNPKRYPLLDKPKAPAPAKAEADVAIKEELNQLFPAPEAIKPLPAADFEEHYRRSARDKKLADFAEVIDEATLKILAEKGINTVADVGRFSAENPKGFMSIRTSEGRMTEKRHESLLDAIAAWTMGVQDDWAAEHPEKGGDS